MVNSIEFTARLKKIMELHQLTASLFADKIGVQRSSISHILSGRNKPSLDFILKVTAAFTEVDIHWLLNGVGNFPSMNKKKSTPTPLNINSMTQKDTDANKRIQKIVVFYSDGTFDEFLK
jgi:transcriptional regulator with XRE-family HTH domain